MVMPRESGFQSMSVALFYPGYCEVILIFLVGDVFSMSWMNVMLQWTWLVKAWLYSARK